MRRSALRVPVAADVVMCRSFCVDSATLDVQPGAACEAVGMANTAILQRSFEWVRSELAREFNVGFEKKAVSLHTGGTHTFNAVAADRTVIATIMNSGGATSGGKKPVGKIRGALAELYFLALVQSERRMLVTTNPDFHELLTTAVRGALFPGLELKHVPLPADLAAAVANVTKAASEEMS